MNFLIPGAWKWLKQKKQHHLLQLAIVYDSPGDYKVFVTVKDNKGDSVNSNALSIYAGNEAPIVSIVQTSGNRSFYLPANQLAML
jgi:hypothetical protein